MVDKPNLKKQCEKGYNCGGACIERADECTHTLKNKLIINKMSSARREASQGYFSQVEQATYDKIAKEAADLFNNTAHDEAFRKAGANYKTADSVRLTGDLRHRLKGQDGRGYDQILDEARESSGLDKSSWNKVYQKVKNNVEGQLVKRLLENKGNCNNQPTN